MAETAGPLHGLRLSPTRFRNSSRTTFEPDYTNHPANAFSIFNNTITDNTIASATAQSQTLDSSEQYRPSVYDVHPESNHFEIYFGNVAPCFAYDSIEMPGLYVQLDKKDRVVSLMVWSEACYFGHKLRDSELMYGLKGDKLVLRFPGDIHKIEPCVDYEHVKVFRDEGGRVVGCTIDNLQKNLCYKQEDLK
ncbi:hypothetical protein HDV00_005834 [Rhizophlyctis rosea]|nr:hypothetical protein HDV00_005834 [Rhizophlyctis rosea]